MQHEPAHPSTADELCERIAANARTERKPVYTIGGGTQAQLGYPPTAAGIQLSTTALNRLVDYPARDMTVTCETGMRIADLNQLLAGERQQLPIDFDQPADSTIGGVLATNRSGPRRFGHGTLRDYLIGMSAVDAAGRLFRSGGRVVKNVAGYDLCKLMVGSLGTLGVITQATFKLVPIPAETACLRATFRDLKAVDATLHRLLLSETRPVVLTVINPAGAAAVAVAGNTVPAAASTDPLTPDARPVPVIATESHGNGHAANGSVIGLLPTDHFTLLIGVEGGVVATNWQLECLRKEIEPFRPLESAVIRGDDVSRLYQSITGVFCNPDDEVGDAADVVFRAGVLASRCMEFVSLATERGIAVVAHAGNGIVTGQLPAAGRDDATLRGIIHELRTIARRQRGNLVTIRCDPAKKQDWPLFGDPEMSWPLMHQIRCHMDPHNLLNPGRFLDAPSTSRVAP